MLRAGVPWFLAALVLAGCVSQDGGPAAATGDTALQHPVRCRLLDTEHGPLVDGACVFVARNAAEMVPVDAAGAAERSFLAGDLVRVEGTAPGHVAKSVTLQVDAPKAVEMVLEAGPSSSGRAGQARGGPTANGADGTQTPSPSQVDAHATVDRSWTDPVTVSGSGNEPHLVVDSTGTIYYAPLSSIFRSRDGGSTWQDVSPSLTEALPPLATDTSVSVAPDDSVWFSRTWGYAGGTIGCTSTDHADTWTCNSHAIPGATDRMWIVGLSAQEGYVQTNEGLEWHVWARSIDGSRTYVPYATATASTVRNGPMVYDAQRDAVWQIEFTGGTQRLLRVDGQTGLVTRTDTGVPNTYALPWLSVWKGTLWTTGEPEGSGASRSVVAARSVDGGATWQQFPIQSAAASVTFSYIAAGPGGRVALVYYGSDKPGPSTDNGGVWSVYVVETDQGLDDHPTWVETRLVEGVHRGNICIGLNCEDSGDDPQARFSGDLIGLWVDLAGNVHVAYNDDSSGEALNQYARQFRS